MGKHFQVFRARLNFTSMLSFEQRNHSIFLRIWMWCYHNYVLHPWSMWSTIIQCWLLEMFPCSLLSLPCSWNWCLGQNKLRVFNCKAFFLVSNDLFVWFLSRRKGTLFFFGWWSTRLTLVHYYQVLRSNTANVTWHWSLKQRELPKGSTFSRFQWTGCFGGDQKFRASWTYLHLD